jgi:hypothetical protein
MDGLSVNTVNADIKLLYRGLLARSVMQAQAASPTFTHVYAALVAIVNTKVFVHTTFKRTYQMQKEISSFSNQQTLYSVM